MAQVLTQRGSPEPTASASPTAEATVGSTVAPDPAADTGDEDDTTIVAVLGGLAVLGLIASVIVIARRRRVSTTQR
jgi:LPXTG-motif cell wall-anchored protein